MIETQLIAANGQQFYTRTVGPVQHRADTPFVLFLHGFPEYGGAWTEILPHFADVAHAVAPDQRGYGRSSKPTGVENYRAQHLATDMLALATVLAPGKPIHLVGHDWGASVAYMMAFMAPERIAKLVILNGVHPIPFQHALIHDAEQRAASQYIRFLRLPDAADMLLADGCARTVRILTNGFGAGHWLTETRKAGYLDAWQQPGAMEGMTAWYKATPMLVPEVGETVSGDPLSHLDPAKMQVRMPHLLLWGLEDMALRPACREGLEAFAPDLRVVDVADADHWIVHQQTDRVVKEIRTFFGL
jgi:epoxide hydrolase 4